MDRKILRRFAWFVLRSDGGFFGNVFELYNSSARRPRLAITSNIDEASLFRMGTLDQNTRLAWNVLRARVEPWPIAFEVEDKNGKVVRHGAEAGGQDVRVRLLTEDEIYGKHGGKRS